MVSGRRGFALIGALWMLVAIAATSLVMSQRHQAHALLAYNLATAAEARVAAESGLAIVQARLQMRLERAALLAEGEAAVDPWRAAIGSADSGSVGRGRFRTRVRDLDAALPINLTEERELEEFLETAGLASPVAQSIAQAVLDWRDADDVRRGRGAERDWYEARGAAVLPRNEPFGTVDELRYVRGMEPRIFARLEPMLTVRGDGRINFNTAPAAVLAALPGIGRSAAVRLVAARQRGVRYTGIYDAALRLPGPDRDSIEAHLPELIARASFETDRLLVEVSGWVDGTALEHHLVATIERRDEVADRTWTRHGE